MTIRPFTIVRVAWLAGALYWIYSAFYVKAMRQREAVWQRFAYLAVIALAAMFFFSDRGEGALQQRFVYSIALRWDGALITVLGVGLAIWARYHLGENWSGVVGLREGHELIRSGPYARLRHPIYSGLLLALAGTALAIGTYGAVGVFAITTAGLSIKAKREEKLLAREFGAAFEEHRRRTGFLLPRIF